MENKNMFERYAALLQEKRYRELRELLAEENEVDLAEFIEGLTQEQAVLAFRMLICPAVMLLFIKAAGAAAVFRSWFGLPDIVGCCPRSWRRRCFPTCRRRSSRTS